MPLFELWLSMVDIAIETAGDLVLPGMAAVMPLNIHTMDITRLVPGLQIQFWIFVFAVNISKSFSHQRASADWLIPLHTVVP